MWWGYLIAALGGLAVGIVGGIFLEKLLKTLKENRKLKCSEILEKNFGKPMYTSKFTFEEAKEWINARQSKIKDGYKGVIMKINKESFKELEHQLAVDKELDNYLLLAIYKNKDFTDKLLVKYDCLDELLKKNLKNGSMVVEL